MAATGGVAGDDEEDELSAVMAVRLRRRNCFTTDVALAHFAFYSQREGLDPSEVLVAYEAALHDRPELADGLARVAAACAEADVKDDGRHWGWPPQPKKPWLRWKRWFRHRSKKPPVTLLAGPNY